MNATATMPASHAPSVKGDAYRLLWGNRSGVGKLVAGSLIVGLVTRNAAICVLGVLAGLVIVNRDGLGKAMHAAGNGLQMGLPSNKAHGSGWHVPSIFTARSHASVPDQFVSTATAPVLESQRLDVEAKQLESQLIDIHVKRASNDRELTKLQTEIQGCQDQMKVWSDQISILRNSGSAVPAEMTDNLNLMTAHHTAMKSTEVQLTDQKTTLATAHNDLVLKLKDKRFKHDEALRRESIARNAPAAATP